MKSPENNKYSTPNSGTLQLRKTDFEAIDFHSPLLPHVSTQSNEFSGLSSAEKFYTNQSPLKKSNIIQKDAQPRRREKKFKSMKADWAFAGTSQTNLHDDEYHLSEISELSSDRPIVKGPEIKFQVFGLQSSNVSQSNHRKNTASLIPLDVRKKILSLYSASVAPTLNNDIIENAITPARNSRLRLESSQIPIKRTRLETRSLNKSSSTLPMPRKNQSSMTPKREQVQQGQDPSPAEQVPKKTSESSVMNSYQKLLGLCNTKLITHLSENQKQRSISVNTQYDADSNSKNQSTKQEGKRGRVKLQLTPIYDCRLTGFIKIGANDSSTFDFRVNSSTKGTAVDFGKKGFSPLGERKNITPNRSQPVLQKFHAKKSSLSIIRVQKMSP